jgi:hypothetical protein
MVGETIIHRQGVSEITHFGLNDGDDNKPLAT